MPKLALFFLGLLSFNVCALEGSETQWGITNDVDEFTDKSVVSGLVLSEAGPKGGLILLTCYAGGFEGKVSAGEYVGDKRIPDNFKFRVDDKEPVEMRMKSTNERYVYFNNLNSPFLKALENGKSTIFVQITNYDYDTSKARFTLNGSTAAVRAVKEACKDREGYAN